MEELSVSKGLDFYIEKLLNGEGVADTFFYETYFTQELKYGNSLSVIQVFYNDIACYQQEGALLFLYNKEGKLLSVFYEKEPILPKICKYLARELPTLSAWLCEVYGERGEELNLQNSRYRPHLPQEFGFYENYLIYNKAEQICIVRYEDILALMVDRTMATYIQIGIFARASDGKIHNMFSEYPREDAKVVIDFLKEKALAKRSHLLFIEDGVGRVISKGWFPAYPKKKPQNHPYIFSFGVEELCEVYLYAKEMQIVRYYEAGDGREDAERYTIRYADVLNIQSATLPERIVKEMWMDMEVRGIAEGRVRIRVRGSLLARDAFEKTFQMLKKMCNK